MWYNVFLSFFSLCTFVVAVNAENYSCDYIDSKNSSTDDEMTIFRLPDTTRPISYDLDIMPDYDHFSNAVKFNGEIEILLYATSSTATIMLNYKQLEVLVVYVREKNTDMAVDVVNVCYDSQNEQLAILLGTPLRPGVLYAMVIEYSGTVKNGINGFYRSTYNDDYGFKE